MSRSYAPIYYVLDGHEPRATRDILEWGMWFEKADRRVARTELLDGSWVSTVFLGLDHSWDGGAPVLFETMVFLHEDTEPGTPRKRGGVFPADTGVQQRYATWAQAEVGHMEIVEQLTAALAAWTKVKLPT